MSHLFERSASKLVSFSRRGQTLAGPTLLAAVLLQLALAAGPADAISVVDTTPDRYALAVPAAITTISVVFDSIPTIPSVSAIRVAGTMSGLHTGTFAVAGDTLHFTPLSGPFFPGEMVHVNYRNDITSAAGGALTGGHYFAFTVAAGVGPATWSERVGYQGSDTPYFIYGGDVDEDGTCDLVVPNEGTGDISTYLNEQGTGVFDSREDYTVSGTVPSSCFGEDFDNDGDQDIATANKLSNNISVLINQGDGTYSAPTLYVVGTTAQQVYGGDFDGDNDIDLVASSNGDQRIILFYNNGDGTFAAGVPYTDVMAQPFSVLSADLDGDGHLDIAVGSFANPDSLTVVMNDGAGGFLAGVRTKVRDNPWDLHGNDLDGDGDFDILLVSSATNRVQFLFNDGAGNFPVKLGIPTGAFPLGAYTADLDGDGDIDALSSAFSSSLVEVFINDGSGGFASAANLFVRNTGSYSWAHDLDGDGDLDLSVADEIADSVFVFYNGASPVGVGPPAGPGPIAGAPLMRLWPNPVPAGRGVTMRLAGVSGPVSVDVVSITGRRVRSLWEGRLGDEQIEWDGRDERGRAVASGRYLVTASFGGERLSREIHVIR